MRGLGHALAPRAGGPALRRDRPVRPEHYRTESLDMTPLQSRDDVPHLARLLLHPVWLGSLALLALNDHWLKGSGLLPGALTGKLSDFAGLMVAPLLLAVLVGVRRRSTWLLAHVAVGLVFAAIQLWGWAADGWSQLMGLVGQP